MPMCGGDSSRNDVPTEYVHMLRALEEYASGMQIVPLLM